MARPDRLLAILKKIDTRICGANDHRGLTDAACQILEWGECPLGRLSAGHLPAGLLCQPHEPFGPHPRLVGPPPSRPQAYAAGRGEGLLDPWADSPAHRTSLQRAAH